MQRNRCPSQLTSSGELPSMNQDKRFFLESGIAAPLDNLLVDATANWGKMNAQQMLEHLADFFEVSTEKKVYGLVTPEEQLPLYKQFLYSDKVFRENTKAPVDIIGEEPVPVRTQSLQEAKQQLLQAINEFFIFFEANPTQKTMHPVFGLLSFEEWILLHYKHVTHHFRQFSLLA